MVTPFIQSNTISSLTSYFLNLLLPISVFLFLPFHPFINNFGCCRPLCIFSCLTWVSSPGSLLLSLNLNLSLELIYYCLTSRGEMWVCISLLYISFKLLLRSLSFPPPSGQSLSPPLPKPYWHSQNDWTSKIPINNYRIVFLSYRFVWVVRYFHEFLLMIFTPQKSLSLALIISPICDKHLEW